MTTKSSAQERATRRSILVLVRSFPYDIFATRHEPPWPEPATTDVICVSVLRVDDDGRPVGIKGMEQFSNPLHH
jgi:hypothetical protein